MGEAAQAIDGYPDYTIDITGKIFSKKKNKYLKPVRLKTGYERVELFNKGKSKQLLVHRLVAQTFLPNPENLPCINHKDEVPYNNHISNLEWCTHKYNSNYGTCIQRRREHTDYHSENRLKVCRKNGLKCGKKVKQFDKNGMLICIYPSAMEAQRQTKIGNQHIIEACQKKIKQAGGFYWEYDN